ncbi:MAG TPA: mechanosensitive ion channel domain-containing protein [Acidimicrobiia bacterium]
MDEQVRGLIEDGYLGYLIRTAVVIVLAFLVSALARRVGNRAVARIEAKNRRNARRAETWWLVMRRVVNIVVFVVAALSLFEIWGLSLTPFVAVGAAVGAGVGFGAQNVVRDIIAGFVILSEDQYAVGDRVTILGTTGTVQDVQLRVTVLRDDEGVVHFVPNGQIAVASNLSRR